MVLLQGKIGYDAKGNRKGHTSITQIQGEALQHLHEQ